MIAFLIGFVQSGRAESIGSLEEDSLLCVTDRELIGLSFEALNNLSPCSSIGAAFLLGLGREPKPEVTSLFFSDNMLFHQYGFYGHVRLYLMQRNGVNDINEWDAQSYVNLQLSAEDILTRLHTIETERVKYYHAFFLVEYWRMNETSLSPSAKRGLTEAIQRIMSEASLSTTHELSCFIKNNLPFFSVEEILSSLGFKRCVQG